jgi:hypothetical protein
MDTTARAPEDLRTRQAALRKAIGVIGVGLPIVLPVGKVLFFSPGLPGSISTYYYTDMRNVLVGAMVAIGVYLLYYPGYDRGDTVTASFAGAGAIVLALSPTAPPEPAVPTPSEHLFGIVHYTAAAVFFLALAYLSFFRFTRTDGAPTERKQKRNVVYRVSGVVMVVSIGLAVLLDAVLPDADVESVHPVFWLEALAVIAFGVSWLVKGEAVLKDQGGSAGPGRRIGA